MKCCPSWQPFHWYSDQHINCFTALWLCFYVEEVRGKVIWRSGDPGQARPIKAETRISEKLTTSQHGCIDHWSHTYTHIYIFIWFIYLPSAPGIVGKVGSQFWLSWANIAHIFDLEFSTPFEMSNVVSSPCFIFRNKCQTINQTEQL